MKKTTLISTLLLSIALSSSNAQAETSKETNVGFLSGAIAGASIGGPIGFFIGGVSGALLGEQVGKANKLDEVTNKLAIQKQDYQNIHQQLEIVQQKAQQVETQLINNAEWMTQGLTLNLMFATNSTELSATDLGMIERLSNILREFPELTLKLDGYADPRGKEIDNMKLSQQRTKTVEKAFQAHGIDVSRVISEAHGETTATANIDNSDSYAMERRVSINFLTVEKSTLAQN